jgi:hypothetical protein
MDNTKPYCKLLDDKNIPNSIDTLDELDELKKIEQHPYNGIYYANSMDMKIAKRQKLIKK